MPLDAEQLRAGLYGPLSCSTRAPCLAEKDNDLKRIIISPSKSDGVISLVHGYVQVLGWFVICSSSTEATLKIHIEADEPEGECDMSDSRGDSRSYLIMERPVE